MTEPSFFPLYSWLKFVNLRLKYLLKPIKFRSISYARPSAPCSVSMSVHWLPTLTVWHLARKNVNTRIHTSYQTDWCILFLNKLPGYTHFSPLCPYYRLFIQHFGCPDTLGSCELATVPRLVPILTYGLFRISVYLNILPSMSRSPKQSISLRFSEEIQNEFLVYTDHVIPSIAFSITRLP